MLCLLIYLSNVYCLRMLSLELCGAHVFYEKTVKFNIREECGLTWYEYGYTSTRKYLADMVDQLIPAAFYSQ